MLNLRTDLDPLNFQVMLWESIRQGPMPPAPGFIEQKYESCEAHGETLPFHGTDLCETQVILSFMCASTRSHHRTALAEMCLMPKHQLLTEAPTV